MYKVWIIVGDKEYLVKGDNKYEEVAKEKAEEFLDIMQKAPSFTIDLSNNEILTVPALAMQHVHFVAKPS